MEQKLIPCWVIADERSQKDPRVTIVRAGGKSIFQVFLEKEYADVFIKESNLTGKKPFTIPTIQYLLGLVEQVQKNGVEEVYVYFREQNEFKRAAIPMSSFHDGICKQISSINLQ